MRLICSSRNHMSKMKLRLSIFLECKPTSCQKNHVLYTLRDWCRKKIFKKTSLANYDCCSYDQWISVLPDTFQKSCKISDLVTFLFLQLPIKCCYQMVSFSLIYCLEIQKKSGFSFWNSSQKSIIYQETLLQSNQNEIFRLERYCV